MWGACRPPKRSPPGGECHPTDQQGLSVDVDVMPIRGDGASLVSICISKQ
jgi:hypothetical protein